MAANLDIALILVDKMVSLGFKDLVNDYILPLNLSKTSNAKTELLTSSILIESLQKGEKHSRADNDSPKGAGVNQVGCHFRLSNVAEDSDQNQQGNESTDDDEENVVSFRSSPEREKITLISYWVFIVIVQLILFALVEIRPLISDLF